MVGPWTEQDGDGKIEFPRLVRVRRTRVRVRKGLTWLSPKCSLSVCSPGKKLVRLFDDFRLDVTVVLINPFLYVTFPSLPKNSIAYIDSRTHTFFILKF